MHLHRVRSAGARRASINEIFDVYRNLISVKSKNVCDGDIDAAEIKLNHIQSEMNAFEVLVEKDHAEMEAALGNLSREFHALEDEFHSDVRAIEQELRAVYNEL